MSDIKVSVVVPVYNVEHYVEQCLNSIISQTLKNIEIICIDDGSTDDSANILDRYSLLDKRIRVIHQDNHGYGNAVNKGILSAGGEYIGIVESDDYIDSKMYEILYNTAKSNNCEIVKSDFYRFTGTGDSENRILNRTAFVDANYNRIINPIEEKESFGFIMNTWCAIYKREFILKYKIFHNETPGASFQDNGFWFKGFCYASRIMFIDDRLYMNRRDNPNSSVASREKVYCANEEYEMIYKFLEDNPHKKNQFIDVFMMKKYHTYLFTISRIDPSFRYEYICNISEEFRNSKKKGELFRSVFTSKEWTELMQLIRNPDEYYYVIEYNRIKVSVVLPVYNCEKYLKRCLECLSNQSLFEIEVICIDDGSVDCSGSILLEYADKDKRFRVICSENKGAGSARNIGLQEACGKYIVFLDADDYFEYDLLEKAYYRAEEFNADITVYNYNIYDDKTSKTIPCFGFIDENSSFDNSPIEVSKLKNSIFRSFMGWAWDKMFKRSFILNNELFFQELKNTNDMYFTYMALYKSSIIAICNQFLYYHRINNENSLSNTREESWGCFFKALLKIKDEMKYMGIWERYKPHFVDYALNNTLWQLKTLKEPEGRLLYEKLKKEWFVKLGIIDAPKEWFRNDEEYSILVEILNPNNEYETYELSKLKKDNKILKQQICELNIALEESELIKERDVLEKERDSLLREKAEFLNERNMYMEELKSIPLMRDEIELYKYHLDETRKSWSYKIGLFITWGPRKIRGCLRKILI